MTGKQILIVEDEKPIRDMIAFGLRRAGFEVLRQRTARGAGEHRRRAAGPAAGRLDAAGHERARTDALLKRDKGPRTCRSSC